MILSSEERTIVLDNWKFWHAGRYLLHAAIVMPDHVHVLITPLKDVAGTWVNLAKILHANKSFTAYEINRLCRKIGRVWQDERFDRVVRDEQEFWEKWGYMAANPVRAGLSVQPEEYPWWYASREDDSVGSMTLVEP